MSVNRALWCHGHGAELEYPNLVTGFVARGDLLRIDGSPSTTNWVHLAIPTQTVRDDDRLRPTRVGLRTRVSGGATVAAVHVYDGETRIAEHDEPAAAPGADGWTFLSFAIDRAVVLWGIGVSVQLTFAGSGGRVEIASAGVDFGRATRIGSERLRLSTTKGHPLELAFRSSGLIDRPNPAITRILVSLHGTGGDADAYLANGLAAAEAAAAAGIDAAAVDNTLVVAPQFLGVDSNPLKSEHYGPLPTNLLRWQGGRASGAESVDLDLDGDSTPDSGRIGSFDVMDELLARVCRRQIFPNLQTIVVAGHSNGGRFLARYAAASRFETRVATPRNVAVRYVVMGSGSYLYMNERRQMFLDDSYLSAATDATWRTRIVSLVDHSKLCKVNPDAIDDWPLGLNQLWEYPARVGADQIRGQFGSRDVRYLVGEHDLSPSFLECPERVQGPDTLSKVLLYFTHLEQFYGSSLRHRLSVVPGVGHSGYGQMVSPLGSQALFGPL